MTIAINLNADMAEGFGAYEIGHDAELLTIVGSVNIACGFHAGDPLTMRRVMDGAKRHGVTVGAHPGFDDLWGFGRRRIHMRPDDLELMIAYQIGAIGALAAYSDIRVTHLKAHGALSNMAAEDRDYAMAIARAIRTVDRDLIYVAQADSEMETAARELGLAVAREGFCDRQYEDNGNLVSRSLPGSVLHDPDAAVRQVLDIVTTGEVTARSGKRIPCRVDTLCIHGDGPSAVPLARAVRAALEGADVRLLTLPEMRLT